MKLGLLEQRTFSAFDGPEALRARLLELRPDVVEGLTTTLVAIAELITDRDRKILRPRFIAAECPQTGLLHLCEGSLLAEVLEGGCPVEPGQSGEMVLTALHSYAMPFLRLRLGDRVKRAWCLALHRLGRLRPSSFVLWIATYRCNLRCPFCAAAVGPLAPDELTTGEARALLDDLRRMRVRRWLIFGGEPALRPDLATLPDYAGRLSIVPGLISNGSLIEERWSELKPFPYFLYMTSLDGLPGS